MALDELSDKIKVTNKNDTHIMVISVRDSQPDRAAVIANEVSKAFVEFSKKITITSSAQIIDDALPGETPVEPKPVVYMGLSAVVGLLIGILAIYFQLLMTGPGASNKRRRPVQFGNAG
jgi:capsular polysaccharide biosynthesis protein